MIQKYPVRRGSNSFIIRKHQDQVVKIITVKVPYSGVCSTWGFMWGAETNSACVFVPRRAYAKATITLEIKRLRNIKSSRSIRCQLVQNYCGLWYLRVALAYIGSESKQVCTPIVVNIPRNPDRCPRPCWSTKIAVKSMPKDSHGWTGGEVNIKLSKTTKRRTSCRRPPNCTKLAH